MALVQRANKSENERLKDYRFQTVLKQTGNADQRAGILG
jgi:hypothetical protein